MFKYVEKMLNDKMETLEREHGLQKEEESIYRERLKYINSYTHLKTSIENEKKTLIAPSLLVIIPILLIVFNNCDFAILAVSAFGAALDVVITTELVQKKKELKRDYSDISSLSMGQISCEEQLLNKILSDYYYAGNRLDKEMIQLKKEYARIAQYKEGLEVVKQPQYQADTEEEYHFLMQRQEEAINPFTDYLNEKIDYTTIHFDSSIEENDKKLVKKI